MSKRRLADVDAGHYEVSRRRCIVVGLGGVGSWLTQALAPMLAFDTSTEWRLVLMDGDKYEERNRGRQAFVYYGEKAHVQADWVQEHFPGLRVDSRFVYIAAEDAPAVREVPVVAAASFFGEGDVILSAVDNHATRLVLSQACQRLRDVTLISGGNELYDGNVQLYVRRRGRDVTPPIEAYHPEIATPTDRPPQAMSCEELARSEPQLLATNLMCASIMLSTFYRVCVDGKMVHPEVYFDVLTRTSVSRERKL